MGGQSHAMPTLWKATGNDWQVSHLAVSLWLFTGTKTTFVSIQAYRFSKETFSGKNQRLILLQIICKRQGASLRAGRGRIASETPLKGYRHLSPVSWVVCKEMFTYERLSFHIPRGADGRRFQDSLQNCWLMWQKEHVTWFHKTCLQVLYGSIILGESVNFPEPQF